MHSPCNPVYFLAEWIAENWWPLLWEPRKSEEVPDDAAFLARHSNIGCTTPTPTACRRRGTIMRKWIIFTPAAAALLSLTALAQKPSRPASIPDFSGVWAHPSGNSGFEPLPSGPRPVTGLLRRGGVSDPYQYVGDYSNPILKPEAAQTVKKHGEIEMS